MRLFSLSMTPEADVNQIMSNSENRFGMTYYGAISIRRLPR